MWVQSNYNEPPGDVFRFKRPIKRVAVIGAGALGLQCAAVLTRHKFTVRLFERATHPGGIWNYQPDVHGTREVIPQKPIRVRGYEPDVPKILPYERTWTEEEDGAEFLKAKWGEHVLPSPVYDHLESTSPAPVMHLPELEHPADAPWMLPHHALQRHCRAYASIHGINSNDSSSSSSLTSTSYGTRVELATRENDGWKLVLRKLTWSDDGQSLKAKYWKEDFDAVLVCCGSYEVPHLPTIEGLKPWWNIREANGEHPVLHARDYRTPSIFKDKNVLIVGGAVSGTEISRALSGVATSVHISMREKHDPVSLALRRRIPDSVHKHKEILRFESLRSSSTTISNGVITFIDGNTLEGIDVIIFATGYRRSLPFLRDYHGRAPKDIIDDGTTFQNIHWTGHYIYDPTLGFTFQSAWAHGLYQAEGYAKVWEETAFLPSQAKMVEGYLGPRGTPNGVLAGFAGQPGHEELIRLYVGWLNEQSLRYGGRLLSPPPLQEREIIVHFMNKKLAGIPLEILDFEGQEERPSRIYDLYDQFHERW
ncbi:FAD/NAD(P)-binding domain-containing protein [Atractiella rhizophila]|nr:FAD/NAD(P)-binding domain-containing protein [Atractiella rhizophila]